MDVPARLKWQKGGRGFVAYPVGSHHRDNRGAEIFRLFGGVNTDTAAHRSVESWGWVIRWEGWFSKNDFAESKQDAADKATEAWWQAVLTEPPRNVEMETAMIAARVLLRPPPNSLLGEDSKFLKSVLWNLMNIYGEELRRSQAPVPVTDLVDRLNEELNGRRASGDLVEPPVVVPQKMRRRRR